jgi:hypothetical protein
MNTLTTKRRHNDRGVSLTEIIVTVFLLSVVGAIIAGTVISAMKTTRSTQSGVEGQSELNDALSRIARDISAADPIIATSTSTGWATDSPSSTEVWVQSVLKYNCVRTRYWLDTTGSTKALKSATQTFAGDTCPDPNQPISTPAPTVKTIIKDFKDTNTTGARVDVFQYFDKANQRVGSSTNPVLREQIAKIARVKIDVGSNVRDRNNGVRLSTSASPRSLDGSLITGVPAPVCVSYASTDTSAGVIGADMTWAHTAAYVPTPIVRWRLADYGDNYTLRRRNTDGTWTTVPYTTTGTNFEAIDTAMRGHHSRSFAYQLDITGPGGSTTCDITVAAIANKPPAAPVITVTLDPDTSAGPHTSDFTVSTARINWPAVAEVEQYSLWKRPIDLNVSPFAATGTGNWQWHTNINAPTTTSSPTMFFDTGYEWMLIATDTDWTAPNGTVGTNSPYSNTGKTLAHNNRPTIANIVTTGGATSTQTGPSTYNENRITWTVVDTTTVDGFRVWKRPTGTTGAWQPASGNLAPTARTFLDTGVPLGSRYDYVVTAYNQGPRGTAYTTGPGDIYYGRNSNVVTILQYPDIPAATAHGTENGNSFNPDGRNSVQWPAVPTATNYQIWEYNTVASAAIEPTQTWTYYSVGNTTLYYDQNGANGAANNRGSRNYYAVIAQNATGFSQNHNVPGGGAARVSNLTVAYQRPDTPSMTWAASPNLNIDAAVGNATIFNYTRNADAGEGGYDNYCAENASLCAYHAYRDSALQETETGNNGDGVIGASGQITWWGSSATWHVYSCNPGGCSNPNSVGANYYPGPYEQRIAAFGDYRSLDQWGKGGAYSRSWTGDGGANYSWTRSYGANRWDVSRVPIADDPFNYGGSQWYNQGGDYNNHAPGWSRWDTTNVTGTNQQLENPDGSPVRVWGTPGSVQRYHINAWAPNGLNRYSYLDYQQKAAPVRFAETARFCNGSNTAMWRLGGRLNPQAALYDGVTGTARNTFADHFRVTTVAGRQSGTGGAFTQLAADLESNSVSGALKGNPSAAGGGTFNDGAWNLDGGQDYFWMHEGFYNGSTGSAIYPGGIFSNSGATWNVPRQSYVGGAMRVTPLLAATGAHAVGYGDFGGISVSLNEFVVNDQSFACSQSSGWAPELDSISRSGVMGGGSTIAPSGGGRTFGLPGN